MIKHIQSVEEFDSAIKSGLKIVDFYANWCSPCRALSPVLEEYNNEYEEVDILKVDCDELPQLASRFNVASIPYIVTFVNGKKTGENVGFLPLEPLTKFLSSALQIK